VRCLTNDVNLVFCCATGACVKATTWGFSTGLAAGADAAGGMATSAEGEAGPGFGTTAGVAGAVAKGARIGGISCAATIPGALIAKSANNNAKAKSPREPHIIHPRVGILLVHHNVDEAAILPYEAET
jgi:hypothetical protein